MTEVTAKIVTMGRSARLCRSESLPGRRETAPMGTREPTGEMRSILPFGTTLTPVTPDVTSVGSGRGEAEP